MTTETPKRKIVVTHRGYGCDTGCCGHAIEIDGVEHSFEFDHPHGDDARKFAEEMIRDELGEEHVADLDWENCFVTDEC